MQKTADTQHAIHPLIAERWSPYWFAAAEIPDADFQAILEAGRWAASSYNEQPWAFVVARRRQPARFAAIIGCLVEGNRPWAESASILMLGIIRVHRNLDGAPNPAAQHDLGLTAATMTLEAESRGIAVHQMSGILPERVREVYAVPHDHLPLTAIAFGYCPEPEEVPERYRERHLKARVRKPLSEFVFADRFGQSDEDTAGGDAG